MVGELSQVIINIINNAKDALVENKPKNPFVQIDLIKEDTLLKIIIKDNAGGIPKEILPRLFEPYFTTKHQSQGTGLGLHMSYKIINESLNGKIYAINEDGGAKFIVEIPIN